MEFLSIIVDRVERTNVFNIVQGRMPSRDTHLQTIVDDDLIQEFLAEIHSLSRISNTMGEDSRVDIPGGLRRIGETFFQQFLPDRVQDKMREIEKGFLFLHVDNALRNIPWELLHDGTCFLADKFYLGKNIGGLWRESLPAERDKLRVLIIADPTDDLEWARKEGEGLFETLNAELSFDRLEVQFLQGKRITKLSLLNALKDKDVIHYAGHVYHNRAQQESGWLLSEGKVLRAREIEKAGFSPDLVFSNGCLSSSAMDSKESVEAGSQFNDLAGSFLRAGICDYIGTNWEIQDSQKTFDFALNFYRSIFEEKSVGEALFDSRLHARRVYSPTDITWANYVLHGNPLARIYRQSSKRTFDASRSVLTARRVVENYPTPISLTYKIFLQNNDHASSIQSFENLVTCFENTVGIVGAIIFGNYRFMGMKGKVPSDENPETLRMYLEKIFETLSQMGALHLEAAGGGIAEACYMHRDNLQKLLAWRDKYRSGEIDADTVDSYLVTFQYLMDNALSDLSFLRRYRIVHILATGTDAVSLQGYHPHVIRLLPAEQSDVGLKDGIEKNRGKTCFLNSSKRMIFSLSGFLSFDPSKNEYSFPGLNDLKNNAVTVTV